MSLIIFFFIPKNEIGFVLLYLLFIKSYLPGLNHVCILPRCDYGILQELFYIFKEVWYQDLQCIVFISSTLPFLNQFNVFRHFLMMS